MVNLSIGIAKKWITKKCTGVADRAEFKIHVAGGNPVILVVRRQETGEYLLNPYTPTSLPDEPRWHTACAPARPATLVARARCLFCFAFGFIVSHVTAVALLLGREQAIKQTVEDPVTATTFCAVVVSICFAVTLGWKSIRRKEVRDLTATPGACFFTGLLLVPLFLAQHWMIAEYVRPSVATMSSVTRNTLVPALYYCSFAFASALSVEFVAAFLRSVRSRRVTNGEPSDAPKDRASRFDNGNSTPGPR